MKKNGGESEKKSWEVSPNGISLFLIPKGK